jgi:RNAse (barnase) inhibitor barstar
MTPYTIREFFVDNRKPITYKQGDIAYNAYYIDGRNVNSPKDFYDYVNAILKYPKDFKENLNFCKEAFKKNQEKSIILVFDHYDLFLKDNLLFKKEIERMFDNDILPFYEDINMQMALKNQDPMFAVYCHFSSKYGLIIKNSRLFISNQKKLDIIKKHKSDKRVFLLYIDGNEITNKEKYEDFLINNLAPVDLEVIKHNIHCYDDVMRDIEVYYGKEPIIIIDNYDNFLKEDLNYKKTIEYSFDEIILPYFEEEVERVKPNGRRTQYMVYCIK